MRSQAIRAALFLLAILGASTARAASHAIRSVTVTPATLNVSAREVATVTIAFTQPGSATVVIVDRDGYPVRTLAKSQPVQGAMSFGWDGRDDRGETVTDEAYSFRVEWRGRGGTDLYFPADAASGAMKRIEPRSYNRRTATLTYSLPQPSRVHIQAGTAALDPKTKQPIGLTMKTVVNREPRAAGAIAEQWAGFDESGAIFIPDLKDFVVAIAATPLPESSIITVGNANRRFVDTLAERRGSSLFTRRGHGEHHAGLLTADDTSPALTIEPLNATWSASDRVWVPTGAGPLRVRLAVKGPTAAAFRKHPATIERFIDGRRLSEPARKMSDVVEIPLEAGGRIQRISINWNSDWGPVAANTIQVRQAASSREPARGTP